MDQKFIEEIKQKLEESRKKLREQLEGLTQEKEFDKNKIQVKWQELGDKDEDSATEVADFQDNISLERKLEESLEKVNKALERIEKKEFGKCDKCQKNIEEARLKVYPEATLCLKCKSAFKF